MNKNTEYEVLVQEIYQTIANENDSSTVKVQHDIKIVGKSGQAHQVDVYYEFCFMGEIHKVVIECKNYSNRVSIGKIRDFQSLLSDIGDVKGICVSKNGFQKGAIDYAKHCNIVLKELRYPTATDWVGRMKILVFNINFCSCETTRIELLFDLEWLKAKYGESEHQIEVSGYGKDVKIIKESGEEITSFYELERQLNRLEGKAVSGLVQTFPFEEAFLCFPGSEPLKIREIKYEYNILVSSEQLVIDGESLTKAIMLDVLSGERQFYKKDL